MRRPLGLPGSAVPLIAAVASAFVVGCGGGEPEPTGAASPITKPSPAAASLATPTRAALATPNAKPLASPVATPAAKPSNGPGRTYEVQPGDTLASIAEEVYGDRAKWEQIYQANRDLIGDNPDAIQVGMELRIPPES